MRANIGGFALPFMICLAFGTSAQSQSQPAGAVLAPGTLVPIRVVEPVDAARAAPGDVVRFAVEGDINSGGVVAVPNGAPVLGEVVAVRRRGLLGRGASISMEAEEIELQDGRTVPLTARRAAENGRRVGTLLVAGAAAGLVLSGAAAPFALLIRGSDLTIPAGTELLARVAGPGALVSSGASGGAGSGSGAGVAAAPREAIKPAGGSTRLSVTSSPNGAEVQVDGSALGNTPLVASLPNGPHKLSVGAASYSTVNRAFDADGRAISLRFVLAPSLGTSSILSELAGGGN